MKDRPMLRMTDNLDLYTLGVIAEAVEKGQLVPVTVDDLPPEAIERGAKAWAETIVSGAEIDQLAVDPLATKQALKILRAALGGTDE